MITVFILCHNRPTDAQKTIASVLRQTHPPASLIISDNSSHDAVEQMVKENFPEIQYIRRPRGLNAFDHFNLCMTEVKTDYFCLFHDDDLMHENFLEALVSAALAFPQAIAIGCNAQIQNVHAQIENFSFKSSNLYDEISSPMDLARRYFSRNQSGIAPFPGYIYKRRLTENVNFNRSGGKYGDVTWLISLAQLAPIVWINQPLMTYRLHGENDGLVESRRDRLKLLAFLKSHKEILTQDLLNDFRISFIYKPILEKKSNHSNRTKLAHLFLKNYRLKRYFKSATYKDLLKRARIKWGF